MGVFFTFSPYVYEDKSYHLHDFKILKSQTLFKMSTFANLLNFFPHKMGNVIFSAAKFQKIAMFCQNKKNSLEENKNNCFIVSLISFMVKKLGFLM